MKELHSGHSIFAAGKSHVLPVSKPLYSNDEQVPFEFFERLTTRLGLWASEQSVGIPISYIETDYFGGPGE